MVISRWRRSHTATEIRKCLTIFSNVIDVRDILGAFSHSLGFTALVTRRGSSYLSSLINLIPDDLYGNGNGESCHLWFAVLFLYVNPVFMVTQLGNFYSFLYFWPGFKTAVTVNFHKTNHCKPNATCTWKHHSGLQFMFFVTDKSSNYTMLLNGGFPTVPCNIASKSQISFKFYMLPVVISCFIYVYITPVTYLFHDNYNLNQEDVRHL
jgi:hypothetical protein